jgi:hypothetical protein
MMDSLGIVDDFHVAGVSTPPDEADAPLIVDSDAVLPLAAASERLELVSRGDAKIVEAPGAVQLRELSPRGSLERSKSRHVDVIEQRFRVLAAKRPDHRFARVSRVA